MTNPPLSINVIWNYDANLFSKHTDFLTKIIRVFHIHKNLAALYVEMSYIFSSLKKFRIICKTLIYTCWKCIIITSKKYIYLLDVIDVDGYLTATPVSPVGQDGQSTRSVCEQSLPCVQTSNGKDADEKEQVRSKTNKYLLH